ncbi:MAG: GNAT family N-acetyltransferase [Oscillospiraceae bacterium]|nr:GNAT family N-acetyltransferase [Oscillospiraceae bacterium]
MLQICPAGEKELPLFAALYDQSWRQTLSPFADPGYLASRSPEDHEAGFRRELREGVRCFLARWDGEPAGVLLLRKREIAKLYLLPAFQGRGIGRALLRFGLSRLEGEESFLWVMNLNRKARVFYERAGFRFSGEELPIDPSRHLTQMKYIFERTSPMTLEEKLRLLCEATGVAGEEGAAAETAASLLRAYTSDITITPDHSVIAKIYDAGEGKPLLMLDAHIDEIGMTVTHIDEDGFVRVASTGGIDRRLVLAQEVILHGEREIPGVVLTRAPHLQSADERTKVPEIKDIILDTGIPGEELQQILSLGDRVTIKSRFTRLQGDHISSKALDDRGCIACILCALEELKGRELPVSLAVAFTSQEEVGGVGAVNSAYTLHPDMAIAVDVSFALTPDADPLKCGKLGEGPMVGISPILDRRIWKKLIALAEAQSIPFQREVMGGGHTGTNADGIALSRGGVRTGLISLPQRYMHTPIEVVRLCDIEAVGKLLAAYALDPAL